MLPFFQSTILIYLLITYHVTFVILGDFSSYTSKPLRDFIYECNNGKQVFFVSTEQEAIDKLSHAI
ncbi:DUF4180 domain-containing protein [Radiobacillus deserti]|uniref:DUF4180 domain-containing protein n=1 Tax=Radiobacillus deserti TaxID=2594883 RepID=A0A516KKX6_9BACI|nr:DUF4180 domain-containing protein [Radiobacillus deserti]